MATKINLLSMIMDYENGALSAKGTVKLFSHIVKNGMQYSLQGHYGRTASAMIQDGLLTAKGKITDKAKENYF